MSENADLLQLLLFARRFGKLAPQIYPRPSLISPQLTLFCIIQSVPLPVRSFRGSGRQGGATGLSWCSATAVGTLLFTPTLVIALLLQLRAEEGEKLRLAFALAGKAVRDDMRVNSSMRREVTSSCCWRSSRRRACAVLSPVSWSRARPHAESQPWIAPTAGSRRQGLSSQRCRAQKDQPFCTWKVLNVCVLARKKRSSFLSQREWRKGTS